MNYFWLISNCFCSSVFAFLFFCISLLLLSVLLLPCSLLYTFNFCYNMCPQFCSVSSFFLVLYFYCSHDVFLFSFYFSVFSILIFFFLLKVMLSCAAAIFHSSPTSNTSVETVLIIFNISTFFLFELLSVLAWVFCNKN